MGVVVRVAQHTRTPTDTSGYSGNRLCHSTTAVAWHAPKAQRALRQQLVSRALARLLCYVNLRCAASWQLGKPGQRRQKGESCVVAVCPASLYDGPPAGCRGAGACSRCLWRGGQRWARGAGRVTGWWVDWVCPGVHGCMSEQLRADISDSVVHTCSATVAAAVYPGPVPQCRHRWQVRACVLTCHSRKRLPV